MSKCGDELEYFHYEKGDTLDEMEDKNKEPSLSCEEILESYSEEQRSFARFLEPLWAALLMTFHMPLFFFLIMFPLMYMYFRINTSRASYWAKRITDPLYVTLPMVRTMWNLSSLWVYKLLIRRKYPVRTRRKLSIPTRWILQSTKQPACLPTTVSCWLYCSQKISAKEQIDFSGMILHFHGGGFIACSPEGHECYLRRWALKTGMPILSVDYSLAPEYPFPTAFNQCASVYSFLLSDKATDTLGFTFKNIVVTGDSAGGNMATAITLWTLTEQIQTPSGVVLIYPSLNRTPTCSTTSLQYLQNDYILPASFRRLYTSAYIAPVWDNNVKRWSFEDNETKEYYLTPLSAHPKLLANFPSCYIICGNCDPLYCDTAIIFNKLTKYSRNQITCDIIPGVTHGFLASDNKMPRTSSFSISQTASMLSKFSSLNLE